MNAPIIRIEVEHLRQTVLHMFNDMQLNEDEMIKTAVEQACNPLVIQQKINEITKQEIDAAIQEETAKFFRHGDGRRIIRDIVNKRLAEVYL